jgi:hypothetical protein
MDDMSICAGDQTRFDYGIYHYWVWGLVCGYVWIKTYTWILGSFKKVSF